MSISSRPRSRIQGDVVDGRLKRTDKAQCDIRSTRFQIVGDGLVHVPSGRFPEDRGLGGHAPERRRTPVRRDSKYASSAVTEGGDSPPLSRRPRRCWRSWSRRISSRMYALEVPYPRSTACSRTNDRSVGGREMFMVFMANDRGNGKNWQSRLGCSPNWPDSGRQSHVWASRRDGKLPHPLVVAQMRLPPVTPVAAVASDSALSSSSYRSRRITGSTMCDARAPP